jgi:transposase
MAILLIEVQSCEKEFAMGHGIRLTAEQWEELDNLRLRTPSADVFRNCLIILMSDCRETVSTIADRLGCGTDTVIRVRRLYRNGGINALYPVKPPGRPCRATPVFLRQMSSAVQANPMTLGYGFSTWSATRLAEHLAKVTGVRFSDDQIRRLLHQQGFSFHRPKHTLKGKRYEAAYEKAAKRLIRLKKKR